MGRARSRGGAIFTAVAAAGALTLDAGSAAGSVRQASFRVSVSGTISSATHTFPDPATRCLPTGELGVWRLLTFRSARPSRVTVVSGLGPRAPVRFVHASVRRLLGEIHLAAPSQYELLCADGSRTTVRADYFTGSTSWRGGSLRLRSPRRGRLVLGPLRGVPEDPGGACGQLSGAPLALEHASGRLAPWKLFDRGRSKLVVRGGMHQSKQPTPTCGVSETVEWKLVLRRIR